MIDLMESAETRLLGIADHDDNDLSPNDQRLLRALAGRELLVQEVIRLAREYEKPGQSLYILNVIQAARKLAEWKP